MPCTCVYLDIQGTALSWLLPGSRFTAGSGAFLVGPGSVLTEAGLAVLAIAVIDNGVAGAEGAGVLGMRTVSAKSGSRVFIVSLLEMDRIRGHLRAIGLCRAY